MKRCLHCMEEMDEEYEVCPHCGYVQGTPPEYPIHLYPGTTLDNDRYVVGTVLSFGGFGVVYRAWDTQLEIKVAIKECFPTNLVTRVPGETRVSLQSGSVKRSMFLNQKNLLLEEAKNTAKFGEHPNIVNVFSRFEENGTAYMVMEYMDGITLKSYLKENGNVLDVDTTITILLSVIKALKEVHKQGALHRDIAPDNIFIMQDGSIKLFDFGAGKFPGDDKSLFHENVVKPGYAPPEQYKDDNDGRGNDDKQGPWTDIYALAATMYRCITGVVPADSMDRATAQYNKEEDPLKAPREIDPSIPEYIDSSLMRAMSITPKFRFQSVDDFENAILNQKTFRSEQEERKYLLRRRLISVACLGLVILSGAFYAYHDYQNKKKAANLDQTEISVWMPVDKDGKEVAQEEFEGMIAEFEKTYPQVKVDVSYVDEKDYQKNLKEAFASDQAPDLFDADYATDDELKQMANLSDVIDLLDVKDYCGLSEYKSLVPSEKMIPMGISLPLVYGNSKLITDGKVQKNNDIDKYFAKENTFCIEGSEVYADVQEELPGIYEVMPVLDNDYYLQFTDFWGVSAQGDDAQINAAKRVIYYFLGQVAQDVYYVQHTEGLPINKAMLSVYCSVNGELYFLEDYVDGAKIDATITKNPDKYYTELYKEEFKDADERRDTLIKWLEGDEES